MSDIKLSICIPTYNRANYLKRAIESCLSSNSDEYNIYIQDNNSSDDTEEIVALFKDDRISYEKNSENIGGTLNTEKLIARANGEYLFFLTDDDCLLPDAISKLLEFVYDGRVGFFTSDTIMYLEISKKASLYSYFDNTVSLNIDDYENIAKVFSSSHIWTRCCFKKSIFDQSLRDEAGKNAYSLTLVCMMAIIKKERLGYIAEPLTLHTWENDIFWEKDVDLNNKKDFLDNEIANIILFGRKYIKQKLFEEICKKHCLRTHSTNKNLFNKLSSSITREIKKSIFISKSKNKIRFLLKQIWVSF